MMTLLGVMQPAMLCISRVDFPCKVHDLVACITDMDNNRQCTHEYLVLYSIRHVMVQKLFYSKSSLWGEKRGEGVLNTYALVPNYWTQILSADSTF